MKQSSFYEKIFLLRSDMDRRREFWKYLFIAVMFITVGVIIFIAFPNIRQFEFSYEKGSPWKYEELTAPFAFEIYKSERELSKEKDELFRDFKPIYNRDEAKTTEMMERLKEKLSVPESDANYPYYRYVVEKLSAMYKIGIISSSDLDKLRGSGKSSIRLVEDNLSQEKSVDQFLTTKSAYEKIVNESPAELDVQILRNYDINNFVTENIIFDEEKTKGLAKELQKTISLTKGQIQIGEKIIDHGEIVGEEEYDILNSYKMFMEQNGHVKDSMYVSAGQGFIICFSLLVFFLYFYCFRQKFLVDKRDVVFILSLVLIMCVATAWVVRRELSPYLIPYALIPITVTVFFDTRTALFTHLTTVLLCSFIVPSEYEFLFLQSSVGMLSICTLKTNYQRSSLFKAAFFILISYVVLYIGFSFIHEKSFEEVDLKMLGYFVINGILLLFANPLIFIIERIFGYISDASLLELANTNNTLLRQFSEVAPGSFQHSMQVSNLAAECAVALNGKANPILVRTAALYHDIGKMNNPEFFTENQTGGRSPHEGRPEDESAEIIKNHVSDGLKIAKQHNLPEKIQDFIASHHGESKAMYFYVNFVKNHPEAVVDEAKFTYPGPRPSSREMCILSMCDAVEAASRSMKDYNDQSINDLVENIISTQVRDGMFDLAPITFDQIKIIKAVLKSKLKTIYHTRISYPELKK